MKSIKSAFSLGFLDWLLPFAVSFVIFPSKNNNYYLFESLMAVIVVFAAVLFTTLYLGRWNQTASRKSISGSSLVSY